TFAVTQYRIDDGSVHALEIDRGRIALHAPIEGRLAIDEHDREAELLREEIARCLDVLNEQLRRDRSKDRLWQGLRFLHHGKAFLGVTQQTVALEHIDDALLDRMM